MMNKQRERVRDSQTDTQTDRQTAKERDRRRWKEIFPILIHLLYFFFEFL